MITFQYKAVICQIALILRRNYTACTMKYLSLLLLCSVISLNTAEILLNSVEDYYWRDYLGLIPIDALIGGKNEAGDKTFIGQMNIRVPDHVQDKTRTIDFVPAIITSGNKTAVGPYDGKAITSDSSSNIKILCTQNVPHYFWYNESYAAQPGCHYIVAGRENSVPLYVGRAAYNDEITLIGKVFSDDRYGKYLFVPHESIEVRLQNYRTLMYCV